MSDDPRSEKPFLNGAVEGADSLEPESHAAPAVSLRSIGGHARRIGHDAAALAAEVEDTSADLERFLTAGVRRRPYTTLGAAAGLGYVLGGGLRSPLTIMLLGTAARILAAEVVRQLSAINDPVSSRATDRLIPAHNIPAA
jgi:hypothetical protein